MLACSNMRFNYYSHGRLYLHTDFRDTSQLTFARLRCLLIEYFGGLLRLYVLLGDWLLFTIVRTQEALLTLSARDVTSLGQL